MWGIEMWACGVVCALAASFISALTMVSLLWDRVSRTVFWLHASLRSLTYLLTACVVGSTRTAWDAFLRLYFKSTPTPVKVIDHPHGFFSAGVRQFLYTGSITLRGWFGRIWWASISLQYGRGVVWFFMKDWVLNLVCTLNLEIFVCWWYSRVVTVV